MTTDSPDWPFWPAEELRCTGCRGHGYVAVGKPEKFSSRSTYQKCILCSGNGILAIPHCELGL